MRFWFAVRRSFNPQLSLPCKHDLNLKGHWPQVVTKQMLSFIYFHSSFIILQVTSSENRIQLFQVFLLVHVTWRHKFLHGVGQEVWVEFATPVMAPQVWNNKELRFQKMWSGSHCKEDKRKRLRWCRHVIRTNEGELHGQRHYGMKRLEDVEWKTL